MRAVATCPFVYKALSTQRRAPPGSPPRVASRELQRTPVVNISCCAGHGSCAGMEVDSENSHRACAKGPSSGSLLQRCRSAEATRRTLVTWSDQGAQGADDGAPARRAAHRPGGHPRRDGGGPGAHPHQRAQHLVRLRAGLPQLPRRRARGCAPAPRCAAASAGGAGACSCALQRACGSQRTRALADTHIHSCEHELCRLALRKKGGGCGTGICITCTRLDVGSRGACPEPPCGLLSSNTFAPMPPLHV